MILETDCKIRDCDIDELIINKIPCVISHNVGEDIHLNFSNSMFFDVAKISQKHLHDFQKHPIILVGGNKTLYASLMIGLTYDERDIKIIEADYFLRRKGWIRFIEGGKFLPPECEPDPDWL